MILFDLSGSETIVLKAWIKWRKGGMGGRKRKRKLLLVSFICN